MTKSLTKNTQVKWNSEVGEVEGKVQKKVEKTTTFKGKKRTASKDDPQYVVKSDKTGKTAMHKPNALKKK